MKNRRVFLSLFFAILVSGCDRIYALLQKEGAQELAIVGDAVPYEKNLKVAEVQKLLRLYGYRVGKPDGILGANTRKAIEDFQQDNDMTVTRFIDDATWERLHMFDAPGLVVDGKINMKGVQQALANAGFDPGTIDGKTGQRTQTALQNFQKACGLKVDGKIGFKTLKRLAGYLPTEQAKTDTKK